MSKVLFKATIPGRVAIKKNSTQRKYSFKLKRTLTMPSDKYLEWERQAVELLRLKWGWRDPIDVPVIAKFTFYFKNRQGQADLSNCYQGPEDALEKAGVIKNDKLIEGHDGSRRVFGSEPRVEIELREYGEGE